MNKKKFKIGMSLVASVPMNNCIAFQCGKDWDSPILAPFCDYFFVFLISQKNPSICYHNPLTIFSGAQSQGAGMKTIWYTTHYALPDQHLLYNFLLLHKKQRTRSHLLFKTTLIYGHFFGLGTINFYTKYLLKGIYVLAYQDFILLLVFSF